VCSGALRPHDILARYGGEEFARDPIFWTAADTLGDRGARPRPGYGGKGQQNSSPP